MVNLQTTVVEFQGVKALSGKFNRLGNHFSFFVYYVDGLLIDTGPVFARETVAAFAEAMRPKAIVLTHYHEDHSGNAAYLHDRLQIPLYMSRRTAERLAEPLILPFYRRVVWGAGEPVRGEPIGERLTLDGRVFEVIPTPGHSDDHISLYQAERRLLFSGDLFLGRRLRYGMREESIADMIASLDRVMAYRFDALCCGHAGFVPDGREALKQKGEFLRRLEASTKALAEKGLSARQIARRLLPKGYKVRSASLGEMSPVHLIRAILADRRTDVTDFF